MHNERQKLDKRKELIRNLATLRKEKEKATVGNRNVKNYT